MTGEPTSACLDEDAALAFLRHPANERSASIDAHLAECADCRRLLLELARSSTELGRSRDADPATALTPTSADRLDLRDPAQRYTLLEPIGAGGMGVVHVAYDAKLDRRVAVKLMRLERAHETTGERLVREATTLARLSHPNIVAVYDVGRLGDQVYIAMELIEGGTLRGWLETQTPHWRDVLRNLLDAGRGLAAAHRAGVIHRDFKPENVLVSNEGRVCVTDFGLARSSTDASRDEVRGPTSSKSRVDEPALTQTGALVGTPAYLAPEVLAGDPATELSDQFSFCVALYESLYGARPFRATSMAGLAAAIAKGTVEAPRSTPVPQWLRQRLLRGLSVDPAARYPNLDALLTDLGRDPGQRLRRAALGAGALAAVGSAFALGGKLRAEAPRCGPTSPDLLAAWGPQTRATLQAAFAAVKRPYAESAWQGTARALDRYAEAWNAERLEACRATHESGEQSDSLLDLRMRCLNRRLVALSVTTDLLAGADENLVARAIDVVGGLPRVRACGDTEALQAAVPLPEDPAVRTQVEEVEEAIAQTEALRNAGELARAEALVADFAPRAEALGHDPLLADALLTQATIVHAKGEPAAAETLLRRAVLMADRGHHDGARLASLSMLVWFVGSDPKRIEEAIVLEQRAQAVLARVGGNPDERAALVDNLGVALRTARRLDEALEHHQRALATRRTILDDDDPRLANTVNNVGAVHLELGQLALAEEHFREALWIWRRAYGATHPQTAFALTNLSALADLRDDIDGCVDYADQALAIRKAALGARHPDTAVSQLNRGTGRARRGQAQLALEDFEFVHDVFVETLGDGHPYTIQVLTQIGTALETLGEYDEAGKRLLAAKKSAETSPAAPMSFIEESLGALSLAQDDPATALEHYTRARDLIDQEPGDVAAMQVGALTGMGRAHLALDQPARAVGVLERAVADPAEPLSASAATAMGVLARALFADSGERDRSTELATRARKRLAEIGHQQETVAEIDAWLAGLPAR